MFVACFVVSFEGTIIDSMDYQGYGVIRSVLLDIVDLCVNILSLLANAHGSEKKTKNGFSKIFD